GAVVGQRRRTEQDLHQTESLSQLRLSELRANYRDAPVGLCFIDRELRYTKVNERMAAINGRSVADHNGWTVREVLPETADTIEPICRRVIETGESVLDIEVTGATAADPGVQRHLLMSYHPVNTSLG